MLQAGHLNSKRFQALIIALMVFFAVLFSAFFLALEATHTHAHGQEHKNCPICVCIQQCENLIQHVHDGCILQIAMVLPLLFLLCGALRPVVFEAAQSLVTQKVRLNN